jgi:beta-1,4-mannosyltransferase
MIELVPAVVVIVVVLIILHSRNSQSRTKVGVIVLGDIGRSPRMRQHCLSLAKEGFQVDYIAEMGSSIHPDLETNKMISIHLMSPYSIYLPGMLNLIVKPIFQSMVLFIMCCKHFWACSTILMQNPPTIPVMAIVWLVSRIYCAKMVIDWHNYGYTILQLRLSSDSVLVCIAKKIERIFGRFVKYSFSH